MRSKKISGYIVISNVTKALEHEWFADSIDQNKFDLKFILFNAENSEIHKYLINKGFACANHRLPSNYFIPWYVMYYWFVFLFKKPQLVHAHLFQASIIGIVASWMAGIQKRIYTRHHADVHHTYHPHAVKYDLLVNKLSTHIIAVSQNSFDLLTNLEHVPSEKITIINHGIPEKEMDRKVDENDIRTISEKYSLSGHFPVVGVVSRFVPEKGIQYIIPAFQRLLQDYPKAKLVLANAKGVYKSEVEKLLLSLPPTSFVLVPFELKIDALFRNFTVFVHVPINKTSEAFGQVYLETMCLGVPMVCTLAGVAPYLVINKQNALVANYEDADSIYHCIKQIVSDEKSRTSIIEHARQDVKAHTFEIKFEKIMSIYQN